MTRPKKKSPPNYKSSKILSQKTNLSKRILSFTPCGHQYQSIARQMGLFEEDNVEASSKLLNVGSVNQGI